MRIGILTFHNTRNYGAVYQAYALQAYLNEKGIDCEIINYNNKTLNERYEINPFKAKNFKQFVKRILNFSINFKLDRSFKNFKNNNIRISNKAYNEFNITDVDREYDIFIAGSDQIWNFKLSGYDKNYFMIFTEKQIKRNSYAASIGVGVIDEVDKNNLKELIEIQNNVSIREKQGIDAIKNICPGIVINQNIDPVFLISAEKWKKIKDNTVLNKKYILIYEVAYTDNLVDNARKLAKEKNLEIYYVSASNKKIKGFKNLKCLAPEKFLNYIYNAEYILTSSFHGMAFSILFNKEFYYDVPDNRNNNFSSRLENLAEITNLKNRRLYKDYNYFDKKIDYDKVNLLIEKEINSSYDYIDKILGGTNE